MWRVEHLPHTVEKRVLVGKFEGRRPLGRLCTGDNIKMDLQYEWGRQDLSGCRWTSSGLFVNVVMNLWLCQKRGYLWLAKVLLVVKQDSAACRWSAHHTVGTCPAGLCSMQSCSTPQYWNMSSRTLLHAGGQHTTLLEHVQQDSAPCSHSTHHNAETCQAGLYYVQSVNRTHCWNVYG